MNFRALVVRPLYGQGFRFLSSKRSDVSWDPTVSLQLNHQTLVLLEKCRTRNEFKQILTQIMRAGLIGKTFPMSRLIYFSAVSHPHNLDMAILLFEHFTFCPNLYIYNTMISAFSSSEKTRSFSIYGSMLNSGTYPDKHTLLYLLKASRFVSEVKQIHCHAVVTGFFSYGYLRNILIKLYMENNGSREIARQVFDLMPERDVVSYNIMVVGYAKTGFCFEAIELFREMLGLGLEPDDYTMLGLILCCGELGDSRLGKSVQAWTERRKSSTLILGNALLDMYVKLKEFDITIKVFDSLKDKDAFSWNTMISGYVKAGELELALSFFDKIPRKDIVSWNSLICGFSHRGDYSKVATLYNAMVSENVQPDKVTVGCLVSAAADTGSLDQGKRIHGSIIRNQIEVEAFLGSALVDMYCKCGCVERAFSVFKGVTNKDVGLWTTIITGFAFHGFGDKALDLFLEMQRYIKPNEVTLIAVLTACTHSGLVDQGRTIFHSMNEKFGIEPQIEHYGCLIDLLGRSGRLTEAKALIEKMPMRASRSIWGALLSACRAYGDIELAEIASTELIKLEPEREGSFVMLSNIYASREKWKDSDEIREIMERKGVKKIAGTSSLVVDGLVHSFVAADSRHPKSVEILCALKSLNSAIKKEDNFFLLPKICHSVKTKYCLIKK